MNAPVNTSEGQLLGVAEANAIADGVWLTRRARDLLLSAMFRFDDAGRECYALMEYYGKLADLVAEWEGRRRPYNAWPPAFPDWMAKHAAGWRADRARKERR